MRIRDWSSDVCSSDLHQHADAAIFGAHDLLFGYFAVGEDKLGGRRAAHADLVDLLPDREPRHILFDQESGDTARSRLGASLGVDDQSVAVRRVGDPEFGDLAAISVPPPVGPTMHSTDSPARPRFGPVKASPTHAD